MELKKYKMSDIATIAMSNVDKKTKQEESQVKLCNFVDVYRNWAITKELVPTFMNASAKEQEIEKFTLHKGQVALTKDSETRDDIGIATYIADDMQNVLLGYHCAVITPNNNIVDSKYLNVFMHSNVAHKYFENNASGSGQRYTLSYETLLNIPVFLPSLDIQKEIGQIFSNLDRKITLNRQINDNLEAMARQLYDYWFVQFDFPDENGKPYKSSGGKMVWNEKLKLKIPFFWTVKPIRDLERNIVTGKTPSTSTEDNFGGDIPFITIDDIRKSLFVYKTERTLTKKGAESQSNKYLPKNALCCSCIGTTGIIGFTGATSQTNQQINSIVFKKEYQREFIYFALKMHFQFANAKTGNILPNMNKNEFSQIPIVYPTEALIQKFHYIVASIFLQIDNNIRDIDNLTKQRDELLPLLMNGQVTVN